MRQSQSSTSGLIDIKLDMGVITLVLEVKS